LSKLRQFFSENPHNKLYLKQSLPALLLFAGSIVFWEVLMHLALLDGMNWRIVYVVAFSLFFGVFFTLLSGFFSKRVNLVIFWVSMSVMYLWYASQLVYYQIFGGFISLSMVQMGGEAVTNFFKETVSCIFRNLWLLALLALPLILAGVLLKRKRLSLDGWHPKCILQHVGLCVVIHILCLFGLMIGDTNAYSVYDIYHNVNTSTDTSVANLGFLTTFRLEMKFMLLGRDDDSTPGGDLVIIDPDSMGGLLGESTGPTDSTQATDGTEATVPSDTVETVPPTTEPVVTIFDQVMEIDFDALFEKAKSEGKETLATLHQYFSMQEPTQTNDFTGMFAGKNLIYLVCESFSPEVISQEMTPTLYRLYNEGIKFTNFYGTYRNVTTNGEYSSCLGLFPDMSRSKSNASFAASADNYLPFALGNIFQSQLGVSSHAFHNYKASYYKRNLSHPNMGYSLKAMNSGMKFSHSWPSSDLEMMEQSVSDYVNEDQFHAYYMTFSGHYQYDFELNPMCRINKKAVQHLDYSETVKAYIACHLELEKAMAYLMEQLEAAGQLEETVIVMTTDHFPYGLTVKQYSELAGETIDGTFGIYKNAFICWSYGLEDPIVVDTPCCTVDILPTLLNLFGFEYDSRLLVGKDVLDPNAQHIAILHNGSFITDLVKFNSKNGEVTYLVDPALVSDSYVDTIIQIVQNEFTVSTAILDYDYYRIVFEPDKESS